MARRSQSGPGWVDLGWHGVRFGHQGARPNNHTDLSAAAVRSWWASVRHLSAPRLSDATSRAYRQADFRDAVTAHFVRDPNEPGPDA